MSPAGRRHREVATTTNYYARILSTPAGDDGLHIGQHAAGSEFLFRAHLTWS
ncbi:hypothetical protein [Amycolatopsis magusensis]|uniref:Uncharacterized protein n=1 Tax=Amycolatopsis magusensis TaxID=882444 RepID=A0ABS4PWT0_9PSEU|nr:hypothetical protein [Amycolatopsis magusensis]MBP2183877.1 hypothetical protein [Amycolatopsis magusensis]